MANFMGGPGCTRQELSEGEKVERFADMTGGKSPTPLMELFGEIAVPLCEREHPFNISLKVWFSLDGWHASWGIGGSVGGRGATPEDAILAAHKNFISLRDRNALRARVADVKRKIRSRK